MNIKKVCFVVKKTTYQKVELSENDWGIMPSNCLELVEFVDNIRVKPARFCAKDKWEKPEFEFQELKIEEHKTTRGFVENKATREPVAEETICDPVAEEIPCDNEISNAIKVLKQAMIEDGTTELGSLAHSWHCNIAMSCFDSIERHKDSKRLSRKAKLEASDDAASSFMKKLFNIKTTNNPPEKEDKHANKKTST
jgi:hypothetical protein